MKIIGLTGGIGSGKTTVANIFRQEGIPIYIADDAGRKVLTEPGVIQEVLLNFGSDVVIDGSVSRPALSKIVFNEKTALERLNSIIHPAVARDFERWKIRHANEPMIIREAAILFESGTYKDCDIVILVTAPLEMRIERVMKRDHVSRDQVLLRMANQWSDEAKAAMSDFIIVNTDLADTKRQCGEILKKVKNL